MVTKAIIEAINDEYSVKVRIPLFDSSSQFLDSTPTNSLSDAITCTLPRMSYIPEVGDIVFVAFEDNDKGRPVIIGCLFKESGNTSLINAEINNLNVLGQTNLGTSISIGDISYQQLKYLIGLNQNIQAALENIDERLKNLEGNNNV